MTLGGSASVTRITFLDARGHRVQLELYFLLISLLTCLRKLKLVQHVSLMVYDKKRYKAFSQLD